MKERETLESKYNFTTYLIGIFLLTLCSLSSYTVWTKYDLSEEPLISQEISSEPAETVLSEKELIAQAEEELLNNSRLHPEFIITSGDTLASLLYEAGLNKNESASLIEAFSKKYNPRKLNIGNIVTLNFNENTSDTNKLVSMMVEINNTRKIEVSRNLSDNFVAKEVIIPLTRKITHTSGIIKNSLIAAALELSIPANAIMGMIRTFSYDVDFQRDIKTGNKLEVVVDKFYTPEGKLSHTGDILYASLALNDRTISIYQFIHSDGQIAYYNEKGENMKKEFLRTPINAARISSKFGMRQHPVLGYSTMHKGIDFAAPMGTPILAAGTGVIESATRLSGYGKYIRIKHNSTYSTAYAHASRFAKGIKAGTKVSQGQVIAYVGSTGIATGAHLHYEVLKNGKQINPLKFKSASNTDKLIGKELESFKRTKEKIKKELL
jgi:murein DD-endopeptidase MepM/ murein hydrolase activator NlpD